MSNFKSKFSVLRQRVLTYFALAGFGKAVRLDRAQARSFLKATTSSEVAAASKFNESGHPAFLLLQPHFSRFAARLCRSAHRALQDLQEYIAATVLSPTFRDQCLSEIKTLVCSCATHRGNIVCDPAQVAADEDVVFMVTWQFFTKPDCVRYYLGASALTTRAEVHVVCAPRWAYRVIEHVIRAKTELHMSGDETHLEVEVGWPTPTPDRAVLDAALILWSTDAASPYSRLSAAIDAARLLA